MADTKKSTFPRVTTRSWWAVRNKFKQTIPAAVTPLYLSTFLNMEPKSASDNIIRPLKAIGLIDQDGKPTDLARRWRDDDQYPAVCQEIREAVYPQELLDALPAPAPDRVAVERWFARHTGLGAAAARQMAGFYRLLSAADPTNQDEATDSKRPTKASKPTPSTPTATKARAKLAQRTASLLPTNGQSSGDSNTVELAAKDRTSIGPSLHIDVQIHISPEASADQIDQIFASMAKHLYRADGGNGR